MTSLNHFRFMFAYRSLSGQASRVKDIIARYGITGAGMDRSVRRLTEICQRFGTRPTFPITASVLDRHPDRVRSWSDLGVHLAIHGYLHVDHVKLSPETRRDHLETAAEIFHRHGITYAGFRCPYLRSDRCLLDLLAGFDFAWDSSVPINHDVVKVSEAREATYNQMIEQYHPLQSSSSASLPEVSDGIVEIPVALPDDDLLVDRLGWSSGQEIEVAWSRVLDEIHERGELFTVQLHPERAPQCAKALEAVLARASEMPGGVWLAELGELEGWWRARSSTRFKIEAIGPGSYEIRAWGPEGLALFLTEGEEEAGERMLTPPAGRDGCQIFYCRASALPRIDFDTLGSNCTAQLDNAEDGEARMSPDLPDSTTENSSGGRDVPVLRVGRWPGGAQSALSVTGDIDAITAQDFGYRLFGG